MVTIINTSLRFKNDYGHASEENIHLWLELETKSGHQC